MSARPDRCGTCGKPVAACKCLSNGMHPWDCVCTRCKQCDANMSPSTSPEKTRKP